MGKKHHNASLKRAPKSEISYCVKLLSGISCCLYFEDSTCTAQCPSMTLSSSEHARCSQEDQLAHCFNHYSLPSTLHYITITLLVPLLPSQNIALPSHYIAENYIKLLVPLLPSHYIAVHCNTFPLHCSTLH